MKRAIVAVILCLLLVSSSYAGEGYGSGVKTKVLARTSRTVSGQKMEYLKTQDAEVTALYVEIAPGEETGWHKHPVPVYGYVLEGKLTVESIDGRKYEFTAGDVVLEVVNIPHNGFNPGNVPLKLVVFYTGEKGKPIVEKVNVVK